MSELKAVELFTNQAVTLSMCGNDVTVSCITRTAAECLYDWLESLSSGDSRELSKAEIDKINHAFLMEPDAVLVNIMRFWDRERIERFASKLLGSSNLAKAAAVAKE